MLFQEGPHIVLAPGLSFKVKYKYKIDFGIKTQHLKSQDQNWFSEQNTEMSQHCSYKIQFKNMQRDIRHISLNLKWFSLTL